MGVRPVRPIHAGRFNPRFGPSNAVASRSHVHHASGKVAYPTGLGNDPDARLKRALKAYIDEDAWATLYSTVSRRFPQPDTGEIAVKVINRYGDEVATKSCTVSRCRWGSAMASITPSSMIPSGWHPQPVQDFTVGIRYRLPSGIP